MVIDENLVTLQERIHINETLYILRFTPKTFTFKTGQHITLSLANDTNKRVYSIASGENENHIDVLIREVEHGNLSKKLKKVPIGTVFQLSKPTGYFTLPDNVENHTIYCIATGSGIAPFISYTQTFQHVPFTIIHGIKNISESFEHNISKDATYISCTSKSTEGIFNGRVTEYIKKQTFNTTDLFYICGNGEMIHEVYSFLKLIGIDRNNINYEEYYNN